MTDPETDEPFEAFLKRRSVLPGGRPADQKLEPPGALDELVLKRAREAIKAQQSPNRTPRWAMPLALAATVLLCLSVVLNIRLNTNRPTGPSVASDIRSREAILPETKVAGSLGPRPPVVAESAAEPPPAASAPPRASARALSAPLRSAAPTAGAPLTSAASSTAAASPAASARALSAPAPAAPSADAPAAVASERMENAPQQPMLAKRKAAEVAAAPHPRDPQAWLQQIEALRAQGKNAQADAEMRLFRATFPGYAAKPVPPASSEPPK